MLPSKKQLVEKIKKIEIAYILYVAFMLVSGVLIIPHEYKYSILLLAFITIVWSLYFVYLKEKKHTVIAINSSILFLLFAFGDIVSFGISSKALIVYTFFIMSFSFFFVFLYQEVGRKIKYSSSIITIPLSLFLYSIPVLYIIYYLTFGVYITPEIVYAILQTNLNESIEFVSGNISSRWIVSIFIFSLVFSYFMFKFEKQQKNNINIFLLILLIIIPLGIALGNKTKLRIIYMLTKTISHYEDELKSFREIQNNRKIHNKSVNAKKDGSGETYIVVIGESLNRNHMSLYGYFRDTTPKLSAKHKKNELLVFDKAYSSHTHTMPSLSLFLTEASQRNNKNYYNSISIIEILKKANIETYWITNQILHGADGNLVGVLADQADQIIRVNPEFGAVDKTRHFDGKMIGIVDDVLKQKTDKNRVLFVHLKGNHGDYCLRYPEEFNKYSGELSLRHFGASAKSLKLQKQINCYDNSVLYNDYVMSSLVDTLSTKNNVSGLIYLADHSDDVMGMRGHNSGMFTFEMTEIPMIMWLSDSYKKKYDQKYRTLQKHKQNIFSNDLTYDTLIGLTGIRTPHYEIKSDLTNTEFSFPLKEAFTLHNKIPYISNKNNKYWIKENTGKLLASGLSEKILPHRINSIGKLNQVINNKYRSFELDLTFVSNDKGGHFIVGHDNKTQSNMTLTEFFNLLPMREIQKIWFDVKNINKVNMLDVRKRLDYLDSIFGIKEKVIIESDTILEEFSVISDAGYHTSYYMPGEFARLYRKKKFKKLKEKTTALLEQIKKQRCKAISFDISLYPYVKNHLAKKTDKSLVFHTWDLSMVLKDIEFFKLLKKQDYFNDNRVKTILVTYPSIYNL